MDMSDYDACPEFLSAGLKSCSLCRDWHLTVDRRPMTLARSVILHYIHLIEAWVFD